MLRAGLCRRLATIPVLLLQTASSIVSALQLLVSLCLCRQANVSCTLSGAVSLASPSEGYGTSGSLSYLCRPCW